MWGWIRELDRILRGEATRISALKGGTIDIPAGGLSVLLILLGLIYGACMGSYALLRPSGASYAQLVASTVKVPALFALTWFVTFPSLYVFNALVGSRLRAGAMLRLLITGLAVMLSVLASFGPIVTFFSVSTTSYPFMVLLNVLMFTIAGFLGLIFLLRTLHRMSLVDSEQTPADSETHHGDRPGPEFMQGPEENSSAARKSEQRALPLQLPAAIRPEGALDPVEGHLLGAHVKTVFRCWIVVFGVVGAQMSWVLRPFIGDPNTPFTWLRPRQSNFFEAVFQAFFHLFN